MDDGARQAKRGVEVSGVEPMDELEKHGQDGHRYGDAIPGIMLHVLLQFHLEERIHLLLHMIHDFSVTYAQTLAQTRASIIFGTDRYSPYVWSKWVNDDKQRWGKNNWLPCRNSIRSK